MSKISALRSIWLYTYVDQIGSKLHVFYPVSAVKEKLTSLSQSNSEIRKEFETIKNSLVNVTHFTGVTVPGSILVNLWILSRRSQTALLVCRTNGSLRLIVGGNSHCHTFLCNFITIDFMLIGPVNSSSWFKCRQRYSRRSPKICQDGYSTKLGSDMQILAVVTEVITVSVDWNVLCDQLIGILTCERYAQHCRYYICIVVLPVYSFLNRFLSWGLCTSGTVLNHFKGYAYILVDYVETCKLVVSQVWKYSKTNGRCNVYSFIKHSKQELCMKLFHRQSCNKMMALLSHVYKKNILPPCMWGHTSFVMYTQDLYQRKLLPF